MEPSSREDPGADTPSWNSTCPFLPFLPVPEPGWTQARGSLSQLQGHPFIPSGFPSEGPLTSLQQEGMGIMDEGKVVDVGCGFQ